jgi:5'-nucleotidase
MNKSPMIVYVDMDDVLCNYSASFNAKKLVNPEQPYPQSQYGFYTELEPIAQAIESVNQLRKLAGFEVYILTAPSILNPLSYTGKRVWVEKHFDLDFVNRLIISPNKGLLNGDYLIDDLIQGRGQENFTGEIIHFGSKDFPDWSAVIKFFLNKR